MTRTRVLHTVGNLELGGGQKLAALVAESLDPSRFAVNNVTVVTLIARAYGAPGLNCRHYEHNRVLGVPEWATADQFDVQASIPAGASSYTVRQYDNNLAPGLQAKLLR